MTNPHIQKWRTTAKILLIIFTTCAFGQFIIEEALQNYGFGIYILISNNMWYEAEEAILDYEYFYVRCLRIMKCLSIGNPITAIWFSKYMEADAHKQHYWKITILTKRREAQRERLRNAE